MLCFVKIQFFLAFPYSAGNQKLKARSPDKNGVRRIGRFTRCRMEESVMKELDYGKIGARIRQVRKAKGWSQEKLAKKCGISMSFLGHIERGTRIMSIETLNSICEALDASADELLWGIPKASETVMQELWNQPESKEIDSYAMYIRIMKSVAEIMGSV